MLKNFILCILGMESGTAQEFVASIAVAFMCWVILFFGCEPLKVSESNQDTIYDKQINRIRLTNHYMTM